MENNELLFKDALDNEIVIEEGDFELVQTEAVIHDQKFETKPTTFAKDAFKRFCKNKSSVVAACIIGLILLLSIIVPLAIPYDVSTSHEDMTYLRPKLFSSNAGWWNGLTHFENVIYDNELDQYSYGKLKNSAIHGTPTYTNSTINAATEGAHGGTFVYSNRNIDGVTTSKMSSYHYVKTVADKKATIKKADNVKAVFDLVCSDEISKCYSDEASRTTYVPAEYRIFASGVDLYGDKVTYYFNEWSNDYSTKELLLNDVLTANNSSQLSEVRFGIELKSVANAYSYVGINSIEFTSTNENLNVAALNMSDPNLTARMVKLEDGTFPVGYWQCVGGRDVYGANIIYATFDYDYYVEKFASKQVDLTTEKISEYINSGYLEYQYDSNGKITGLNITDKKNNPVESIDVFSIIELFGENIISCKATVTYYRFLGFNSMPKFIFGTDNFGRDVVKLSFIGLRTSLAISICVCIVNFSFGLVWGAISGYFGGTVDLLMERFCDILGGIPFTVMFTLLFLLWERSFFSFAVGMCMTGWMGTAARTRTQFYRFKGREYVLAARTLGASDFRLIFKHILPNALGTIVTGAVLMIPSVIFSEASLAYLGLGLQGVTSLGVILSDNQQFLKSYPALILFPSAIISLLMISFNLFGNGLRDALNPSLKGSE